MKIAITRNTLLGLSLFACVSACSGSSNNNTSVDNSTGGTPATGGAMATGGAPSAGGTTAKATGGANAAAGASATGGAPATGGKAATGGTSATGGSSTAGGASATGGSSTAGGASATGGSSTAGGASATGGSATAGGASTTGGTSAAGGSTLANACVADTSGQTLFCRPSSSTVNIAGTTSLTLNGITFTPNGTSIAITTAVGHPVTSGTTITGVSPFTDATCNGAGVDAEVANSNPAVPYTGMSVTVQNSGADPITVELILDDRATGGQYVERTYTLGPVPADATAHSYTLTWSGVAHTDSCNLPSGSTFDQTHILGLGFGVVLSTASTTLNVTLSNITFTTT